MTAPIPIIGGPLNGLMIDNYLSDPPSVRCRKLGKRWFDKEYEFDPTGPRWVWKPQEEGTDE